MRWLLVFARVRHEFQSDKFNLFGELKVADFLWALRSNSAFRFRGPIGVESAGS